MTVDNLLRTYLSDNAAGASPRVLAAVVAADRLAVPYGNDPARRPHGSAFGRVRPRRPSRLLRNTRGWSLVQTSTDSSYT